MADRPSTRPARPKRVDLRRGLSRPPRSWRDALRRPSHGWGVVITLGVALLASAAIALTREQPLVKTGRIMPQTRTVRVEFTIKDEAGAEQLRRQRRQETPRVYVADVSVFDDIRSRLEGLPAALADATSLADVAPEIVDEWRLDEETLAVIRSEAVDGRPSGIWVQRVDSLITALRATPIFPRDEYQLEQQETSPLIDLRFGNDGRSRLASKSIAINVESPALVSRLTEEVRSARFGTTVTNMIVGWLDRNRRPTYLLDSVATEQARDRAAAAVEPESRTYPAGAVLATRGETLSAEQRALIAQERQAFLQTNNWQWVWLPRLGVFAVTGALILTLVVFLATNSPRITRNTSRMTALGGLMVAGLVFASVVAIRDPGLMALAGSAGVIFVASVVMVAYDQKTALAVGLTQAVLTNIALAQPVTALAIPLVGVCTAVLQLRELRHRNALLRASVMVGVATALATLATLLVFRPAPLGTATFAIREFMEEILQDSAVAGLGGLLAISLLTLLLPTMERVFGIVTGMTLIELRDPKQPLLRELQQRAPGTYNHSLTVAALAETAAEAIGADGLHLYVGALYHDIGKMNKPDYFVENQTPGFNRHSKLSPAMSLLVIVGHVKDGIELAREYNIPRSLHHYIESHHGTTLVEYFFQQAKDKAEKGEAAGKPAEIEYRYPGPKPRTKEAGILMLCDAVESATRAMADPTPSRIEQLVRKLSAKRLSDGQLDDCDLSLREVHVIEDAIIRAMCSIYHGRIAYPEASQPSLKATDYQGGSGPKSGEGKTEAAG